jgi:hypothetical protein
MNGKPRLSRASAVGAAIVAAAGIAVFLVLTFWDPGFLKSSTSAERTEVSLVSNLLRTDNRAGLEACIDFGESGLSPEQRINALQNIENALDAAAGDSSWAAQDVADLTPRTKVEIGCPSARAPVDPDSDGTIRWVAGYVVEVPSSYLVFYFVLPDADAQTFWGEWDTMRAPQEMLCSGDSCVEVTVGLYMAESDVLDPVAVQDATRDAVGLR